MVELEVKSDTEIVEHQEDQQPKEAVLGLAACIGKLKNEEKSIVKIDINKVKKLCDAITDAATYKRITLLPNIQSQFNQAFNILEEFQKGNKHFDQLLGIIDKTESDCEVDYFQLMLTYTKGVTSNV